MLYQNTTCSNPSMLDHFVGGSTSRHSRQVRADLACAVKGAPVCWLLVAVSLQLALDDVSRVDCEPVHCPCCTPSYHEGPLPQLICIAQTLLKKQSHPSMQRPCHVHETVCFLNCLLAVPAVQCQQQCNFSVEQVLCHHVCKGIATIIEHSHKCTCCLAAPTLRLHRQQTWRHSLAPP